MVILLLSSQLTRGEDGAVDSKGLAPGLQVSVASQGSSSPASNDMFVLPTLAVYVKETNALSPRIAAGPFSLVWTGFISAELRGEYTFQAELRGSLKLELNGKLLLACESAGGRTPSSDTVRLNKGTNALRVTFTSPATGDAWLRMEWIPKGGLASAVPQQVLSHLAASPELQAAAEFHFGRTLFLEHHCARCHASGSHSSAESELAMDGPSFEGIGARLSREWMAEWIRDPKSQRPGARMPRMFQANAEEQAEAAAAFLSSLRPVPTDGAMVGGSLSNTVAGRASESDDAGQKRFDELHCSACHNVPGASDVDPKRVSLGHVGRKYVPGQLIAFLRSPSAHDPWTRMPDFKLSTEEAAELAAYLLSASEKPRDSPGENPSASVDADRLARGRQIIQTSGCLNCHALGIENSFTAKPLSELPLDRWKSGCLSPRPAVGSRAPFFGFTDDERAALQRVGTADSHALRREAPIEFAQRQLTALRCGECHGKFEGFPTLEALGGKLKPEWARAFIAGEVKDRPRPWLPARMPAFARHAEGLAQGMAMLYGYPPATPAGAPIDLDAAAIGQKLVAIQGGLSCIACHAVGHVRATQVFENAGINLAYSGARLLKAHFERWVRNPLAIDPVSKMPVFFDEELRSPLLDFYDGDGAKQIEALWQYVRLGDKMPPPPGTEQVE